MFRSGPPGYIIPPKKVRRGCLSKKTSCWRVRRGCLSKKTPRWRVRRGRLSKKTPRWRVRRGCLSISGSCRTLQQGRLSAIGSYRTLRRERLGAIGSYRTLRRERRNGGGSRWKVRRGPSGDQSTRRKVHRGRLLSGGARPTVRLRLQRARSGLWRLRQKRPRRRRSARTYIIQLNRSWHGKLKVYREPRSGRSREGMILFAALGAVSLIV